MKYDDRREGASRYNRDNNREYNRDNKREYSRENNRDMKGPARRTYGVRSEEGSDSYRSNDSYRGNGYRGQNKGHGNAPRVGAVYQNVPAAQTPPRTASSIMKA